MFKPDFYYEITDEAVRQQLVKYYLDVYETVDSDLQKIYGKYNLPRSTPQENIEVLNKMETVDRVQMTRMEAIKKQLSGKLDGELKVIDDYVLDRCKIAYQQGYYFNAFLAVEKYNLYIPYPLLEERTIKEALKHPLSYLSNSTTNFAIDRKIAINKINDAIIRGIIRGDSYTKVSKEIDRILGFRDKANGIIKFDNNRGRIYKSLRIYRTESGRMRSLGNIRQLDESQTLGIEARLKYLATLDTRTRRQSGGMDGQISNENGEFLYPDGQYYQQHNSANPDWDINDRCTTITVYPDMPSNKVRRVGSEIIDDINFQQWAKKEGISKNIYGEVIDF